jgi:hypothetical protein
VPDEATKIFLRNVITAIVKILKFITYVGKKRKCLGMTTFLEIKL